MDGMSYLYVRLHVELTGDHLVIAVGDTFVFSTQTHITCVSDSHLIAVLYPDVGCLTTEPAIPYMRLFKSIGVEERTSKLQMQLLRDAKMTTDVLRVGLPMQGGTPIDVMTGHPMFLHSIATIRPFTDGFSLEGFGGDGYPIVLSYELQVLAVWRFAGSELLDAQVCSIEDRNTIILCFLLKNCPCSASSDRQVATHGLSPLPLNSDPSTGPSCLQSFASSTPGFGCALHRVPRFCPPSEIANNPADYGCA
jgi:hypothetical protein